MTGYVLNDNTSKILLQISEAKLRALERMGSEAEGNAKDLCPVNKREYGGVLRQSITHKPGDEDTVHIGTNNAYAAYVETGTGRYYDGSLGGSGRPGWWVYVKGSSGGPRGTGKIYTAQEAAQIVAILRSKGLEAYMTEGQKPQPFLRPAVTDHMRTYRNILKDEMKNG